MEIVINIYLSTLGDEDFLPGNRYLIKKTKGWYRLMTPCTILFFVYKEGM